MTPITIELFPLDYGDAPEVTNGWLVSPDFAVYYFDGRLWIARVIPGNGRYHEHNVPGMVLATIEAERAETAANDIIQRLRDMSGLDFLAAIMLPLCLDVEFKLA